MRTVLKWMARHSPKGLDIFFAAQFGIVECLGTKRYWEVVIPIVRQQIKSTFRRLANGRQANKRAN